MVIAEIPLWVTHRDSTGGNDASEGAGGRKEINGLAPATASLSLLHDDRSKCAIYSVDVHPSGDKFATAGGDGTVRLWSTMTLFSASHQGGHFEGKEGRAGPSAQATRDNNGYKSTSSSSGSSSNEEDDGNESAGNHRSSKRARTSANSVTNDSSSDDRDSNSEMDEIHDLTERVRSKKQSQLPEYASTSKNHQETQSPLVSATTPPRTKAAAVGDKSKSPESPSRNKRQRRKHRLLCTLSAHTGSSVLAVRFSTSGNFLASAGDDGCVCVYAPNKNNAILSTGNLVDNKGAPTIEHWSRILLCRGHSLDVVGLAWAPDDSHLVSCSLDRETPIIVWKVEDLAMGEIPGPQKRIRQPYKILGTAANGNGINDGSVHTSTVKGVTFDPAGSYLASSGDDPAVMIWRAHDDWGLEKRIDASNGIFRKWSGGEDALSLSSQSIFRRISWSTDGSFICSTNSVVKNKHVVSTISRDGWSVAADPTGSKSNASGAATLVGHKQPIVVSRVANQWLDVSSKTKTGSNNVSEEEPEEEDEEPPYATLLALGDKKGFVTVWSTRKSKPVFKLQCSESKCTVTDLAWGRMRKTGDVMLLVSLLDGQVVALKFRVPDELGALLSNEGQAKVFRLRYGIDLDSKEGGARQKGQFLLGERAGPQLIENALQMSLERKALDAQASKEKKDSEDDGDVATSSAATSQLDTQIRSKQQETYVKGGKKRVRPVLMAVSAPESKKPRPAVDAPPRETDALEDAVAAANRAASAASAPDRDQAQPARSRSSPQRPQIQQQNSTPPHYANGNEKQSVSILRGSSVTTALPHRNERIHSIDLPTKKNNQLMELDGSDFAGAGTTTTAECINTRRTPVGSKGPIIPCIGLSITRRGKVVWRDEIPGTTCTATSASSLLWAIGTTDGVVQLYKTCASVGWESGRAFRAMAPLVFGSPIVELQLQQMKGDDGVDPREEEEIITLSRTRMFCVLSDGSFFVYELSFEPRLLYKGSILPAMNHMSLGVPSFDGEHSPLPKLSKVQITEEGHLLLLLSLRRSGRSSSARGTMNDSSSRIHGASHSDDHGAGGSIQGFVYSKSMELWTRISDSRFVCSDFYKSLPSFSSRKSMGPLSQLENSVRMGSLGSPLKPSNRQSQSSLIFSVAEEETINYIPTRSHCEDRIACALQLKSPREVKYWLLNYVKVLILGGHESTLRVVLDMIHGAKQSQGASIGPLGWISSAVATLNIEGDTLIRDEILPQMGKNRSLQRLTNEIQLELNNH